VSAPSRQVHEKSILLPLLPATLLGATGDAGELTLRAWLPAMAAFSMYPLLKKDRLIAAYAAALAAWAAVAWPAPCARSAAARAGTAGAAPSAGGGAGGRRRPPWAIARLRALTASEAAVGASALGAALIHALGAARGAPARYPYLLDLLVTSYSFVHFAGACVWLNMHALAAARTARRGTST
jgi:alpha-1,3-glucosyltransferase